MLSNIFFGDQIKEKSHRKWWTRLKPGSQPVHILFKKNCVIVVRQADKSALDRARLYKFYRNAVNPERAATER